MAREVTVRMEGLLGELLQGGALIEEAFTVVEGQPMSQEKLTQAQVACRNLRHAVEDLEALLWEGEHGAPRPWSMKEGGLMASREDEDRKLLQEWEAWLRAHDGYLVGVPVDSRINSFLTNRRPAAASMLVLTAQGEKVLLTCPKCRAEIRGYMTLEAFGKQVRHCPACGLLLFAACDGEHREPPCPDPQCWCK